jgi:hypothetical protein
VKESESVLLVQEHCEARNIEKKSLQFGGKFDDNAENSRFLE